MRKALYILSDLEDRDILWLSRSGEIRVLDAGTVLIAAGREVRELFFVTDGSLAVTTPDGRRVATLALGDVIGEMSFVEKRLPNVSVTALEPTRVLAVPREAILAAFTGDTGFAARFYRALTVFLSDRLRSATTPGDVANDELDEGLLDNLSSAGGRFIRLLGLLEGRIR